MPKRYNTPHRSRVVKTRLSEDEYADFTARLAPYGISQSEFLRQAIRRTAIRPIIHVSAVNDELLSAVGKLTAEYGRIGGNLNQIARYLNEYGVPYNALSGEVRAAIADLAALKYEILLLMLSWDVMIPLCHADMKLPGYLSWNVPFDGAVIRPITEGISSYIHALPAL